VSIPVYVVSGGYAYEGYSRPDSVWADEASAKRRAAEMEKNDRYDFVAVHETQMEDA